jgi:uncharacterized membrane protein
MNIGLKTFTFALTHFSVAFTVAWLLTGSLLVGGLIALVEPAINTVAYVIHEKIWQNKQHARTEPTVVNTEANFVRIA